MMNEMLSVSRFTEVSFTIHVFIPTSVEFKRILIFYFIFVWSFGNCDDLFVGRRRESLII